MYVGGAGRSKSRPQRLQPRQWRGCCASWPGSNVIDFLRVHDHAPQRAHYGFRALIWLLNGLPTTVDEGKHVGRLEHPGVMTWCEMDSVEETVERCMHVDAGGAVGLVSSEVFAM